MERIGRPAGGESDNQSVVETTNVGTSGLSSRSSQTHRIPDFGLLGNLVFFGVSGNGGSKQNLGFGRFNEIVLRKRI